MSCQVVGRSGGLDVRRDVRRLPVRLTGVDPELLDQGRPDHAEQHGAERQQCEADRRQDPGATPDVEEEQHRTDHGDPHEDVLGRQHGVLAGVGHAGDERALVVDQVEAVEPVVGALGEHEQAQQHRQLHLGGAGEPVTTRLQLDPAVQVVDQRRHQEGDDGERHRGVDQVVEPGQVEDVEADVTVEVGVLGTERDAVAPQQELAPLARRGRAGEEAQQDRDGDRQPHADGGDHLAVAVESRLLRGRQPVERAEPESEVHRGAGHQPHQSTEGQEQPDPGPQQGGEHVAETRDVVPHPVGPERRERGEREEAQDQDPGRDDQCARATWLGHRLSLLTTFVEQVAHGASSGSSTSSGSSGSAASSKVDTSS